MERAAVVSPPTLACPLRLAPFRAVHLPARRVGDPATMRQLARGSRGAGGPDWRERTQARQDARPAVYLHEYTSSGMTVRGLVGALELSHLAGPEDLRSVLPHEGVRARQAEDLASRMAELQINPAPILLVQRASSVRDLLARATRRRPERQFTDRAGQRHRVWALRDPEELAEVERSFDSTQAVIADGHHRFAAYLQLQHDSPGGPADFGLAMVVDQADTPLFLGPVHRVLVGPTLEDLAAAATTRGMRVVRRPRDAALDALGPHALALTDGASWATLELGRPGGPPVPGAGRAPVEVLHEQVLPALADAPQSVEYLHSVDQALTAVRRPRRLAVLMPAPDLEQIRRIAASGRLLPEKTTSFQPKPSAGVLMRTLRDG